MLNLFSVGKSIDPYLRFSAMAMLASRLIRKFGRDADLNLNSVGMVLPKVDLLIVIAMYDAAVKLGCRLRSRTVRSLGFEPSLYKSNALAGFVAAQVDLMGNLNL